VVEGDDLVRPVEALERAAPARPDVEDALVRLDAAELEEAFVAAHTPRRTVGLVIAQRRVRPTNPFMRSS
jgi:hypothetical protein